MNYWIMTIFNLKPKFEHIIRRIDREIEAYALSFDFDNLKLYNKIIALNNYKLDIVNIKVIYDKLQKKLSPLEWRLLKKRVEHFKIDELSNIFNMSRSSLIRKGESVLKKSCQLFEFYGYNKAYLDKLFENSSGVKRIYTKYARLGKEEREKDKATI